MAFSDQPGGYQDKNLVCKDCSQPFIFTAGEQEFYDSKQLQEQPKRCKPCRDIKKNRNTNRDAVSMAVPGDPPRETRGRGKGRRDRDDGWDNDGRGNRR